MLSPHEGRPILTVPRNTLVEGIVYRVERSTDMEKWQLARQWAPIDLSDVSLAVGGMGQEGDIDYTALIPVEGLGKFWEFYRLVIDAGGGQ